MPISREEIIAAIRSIEEGKALGPDDVSTLLATFVSSANIFIFDLMPVGKSFMNIKKRIGPITEPYGTLLYRLSQCNFSPLITTRCFLPLK